MVSFYSIVKNSGADLGVNSKVVQIRPTVKAVSTKISKKLHICQYFDIAERKQRAGCSWIKPNIYRFNRWR